jgi:hypothetical protein
MDDSYGVYLNDTLSIDLPGVLANDTDADGDSLTAVNFSTPAHGSLTPNADGSFTYTPDTDYIGEDTFTYQADDGNTTNHLSTPATVTITVLDTSCLTVDPESLEKSLNPNTTGTSILSLTNTCDYPAPFNLEEWEITLQEGFEGGIIPVGWETSEGDDPLYEWFIIDREDDPTYEDYVHQGRYAAWINLNSISESDEWLISSTFDPGNFSSMELSFWAYSSTNYPPATVKVWVTDESGDPILDYSTDPLWDMIRDEAWPNKAYRQVFVNLNDFAGYPDQIRIAWQYLGEDGQSFGLDSINIMALTNVPWLSADPSEGQVPAGDTIPITVNFDSTGLAFGDYFAGFNLNSYLSGIIPVPVTLHVGAFGYDVFLPLVLR